MKRLSFVVGLLLSSPVMAAETTSFSYDALGRLVGTSTSGTINNGLTTTITLDKVDNRSQFKVTGAGFSMLMASEDEELATPELGEAPQEPEFDSAVYVAPVVYDTSPQTGWIE